MGTLRVLRVDKALQVTWFFCPVSRTFGAPISRIEDSAWALLRVVALVVETAAVVVGVHHSTA